MEDVQDSSGSVDEVEVAWETDTELYLVALDGSDLQYIELIGDRLTWTSDLSWARTHDDGGGDGGVAQHGGHTPNNRLTETCSLGRLPCASLILDIHVTINLLTSIT